MAIAWGTPNTGALDYRRSAGIKFELNTGAALVTCPSPYT